MFEFLKDKKGEPPALPEGTVRRRYSIEGQVQGVGFRYRARYAAQSLELTGWVENEDDGSVTLVDCGLKRAPATIVKGLASIGKHPRDVQRILLTHAHFDHAGGAKSMVEASATEGVLAHAEDVEYLASGSPAPTDTTTTSGRLFARRSRGFDPVPVVKALVDGELVEEGH